MAFITEAYLRQIILEELYKENLILEESFNLKKMFPWVLAGLLSLSATKASATQDSQNTTQSSQTEVYGAVEGVEVTRNAIQAAGGNQVIRTIKDFDRKATVKILEYFLNPQVIAKIETMSGKKIPEDFAEKFRKAIADTSEKNSKGNYRIVLASERDYPPVVGSKGGYSPESDVIVINAEAFQRHGAELFTTFLHEKQHQGYHKVQDILGIDLGQIHDSFRDFAEVDTSSRGKYLRDDAEVSAYSYIFRDALKLGHTTSEQEIIDAFKQAGVELEKVDGSSYAVAGLKTYPILNQLYYSFLQKFGKDSSWQIYSALKPFCKTIEKDGQRYEVVDLAKVAYNLSKFAALTVNSRSATAE